MTEKPSEKLSLSLAVPVCTVLGYALIAQFKKGYLEFFGVPASYMQLTLVDLLMLGPGIAFVVMILLGAFWRSKTSSSQFTLVYYGTAGISFCLYGWAKGMGYWYWGLLAAAAVCVIWDEYSPPKSKKERDENAFDMAAFFFGDEVKILSLFLFLIMLVGTVTGQHAGFVWASMQDRHVIAALDGRECVVVENASDQFLCVHFAREPMKLHPEFVLLPKSGTSLSRTKLGRFPPAE